VLLRGEGVGSDGVPRFANVAMAVGADDIKDGRGMAYGDFDLDGDLDVVMNTNPGDSGHVHVPPVLLRNDLGQGRHWLSVELIGTRCNRDALGAEVEVRCAARPGVAQLKSLRHVTAGSGYASQNEHRLHFGLGDSHNVVTTLKVRWPGSRAEQTFENVPANRWVRIREGAGIESFDPRDSSLNQASASAAGRRRVER
jgi:hypothetical protein